MKIYIIRHAETEYNKKGIIQGSEVDSDINHVGESQANSFFEYYKDINFCFFYVLQSCVRGSTLSAYARRRGGDRIESRPDTAS